MLIMRRSKDSFAWIKASEEKRLNRLRVPSETFVSDKYDFSPGAWNQTREIYIPSLNMRVGPAIRSLETNHKARCTKRKKGEPYGDTSCLILKLQAGLGMEQFDFLKQEAEEAGYTPQEYEREYEHLWGVGTEDDNMEFMSEEEKQLRREELLELESSRIPGYDPDSTMTDLEQRMLQAEKDKDW